MSKNAVMAAFAAVSLKKHGKRIVKDAPRTFEGLREYLRTHNIEGLVLWKDGEPHCKIKRSPSSFRIRSER